MTLKCMDSSLLLLLLMLMTPMQNYPVPKPYQDLQPELAKSLDPLNDEVLSDKAINETDTETESPDVFTQVTLANKNFKIPLHDSDIIMTRDGRSVLKCKLCTWTKSENGLVMVPYILSPKYTSPQVSLFMNAMQEIESVTCVRFVQRTNEVAYLRIVENGGCASFIGKTGGVQDIYLNSSTCMTQGTIQHQIQHSLGFVHEHSRGDRDNYVDIVKENISPEFLSNFEKVDTNNNLRYDFASVMHYPIYIYSKAFGLFTIIPKPDASIPIGQRNGLSTLDIAKINDLYRCDICATLLPDANGTVTSENYPDAYPNNYNCVWLIRVPYGKVRLNFNVFDLEASDSCSSAYMQIFDGPSKKSSVLLGKTCGAARPRMISSSNQVFIVFVSNGAVTGKGFNITYDSVPCGGVFYAPAGNFTSPAYPKYAAKMQCKWTIYAAPEYKVSLTFSDFELEPMNNQKCSYDYVSVYDGLDDSSSLLGKFCGTNYTSPITSTGPTMYIEFVTDKTIQFRGFRASYTIQ